MRANVILRYMGIVMLVIAFFMLLSAGVSLFNGRDSAYYPLLLSALLTTLLGVFPLIFVERAEQLESKEGYCVVIGSWLMASIVGMFPYVIWGGEFTFVNAWFESVSGYTTTGSSILQNVEALPRGLLFWRMCSTWLGGCGVVMFALLVLPSLGTNRMMLSSVELSTIARHNYHYKTQMIVQILLMIYIGLTVITTLFLKLAGLEWFDAVAQSMSAVATSGFSTKNASIGFFNDVWVEIILIAAMLIASIHFGVLYATISGQKNNLFRSEVVRFYLGLIAVAVIVATFSLWLTDTYASFGNALRYAGFQIVSLITTTGFATADTNIWTPLVIVILIFVSIVCGCAGSTSGGLKIDRLLLSLKNLRNHLSRQQHPNAILRIRIDGNVMDDKIVSTTMIFIVAYLLAILAGTLFATLCGVDLMTGFSSAIASLGNVGPGFDGVSSLGNYSALPAPVKVSCTFLMLLGRLEIFGLVQLFFLKWWR